MATSEGPEVLDLTNADAKRVCSQFRQLRTNKGPCYFTTQPVDSQRSFLKIFCRDPELRKAFAKQIHEFLGRETTLEGEETARTDSRLHTTDRNSVSWNGSRTENADFGAINGAVDRTQQSQNAASESGAEEFDEFVEEAKFTRRDESSEPGTSSSVSSTTSDAMMADGEEQAEPAPFDAFTCPIVSENVEGSPRDLEELFLLRPYAATFVHRAGMTRGTALQSAAWPDLFRKKSMALIGPPGCGKTFAYLPVAITLCLNNVAVVVTPTEARTTKLDAKLSHFHLAIDVTRPRSKIYNSKKQLLICTLHWFHSNRRNLTPSVVIFDKLDRMVESAQDVTCVEVADSCPDIPLIATARQLTLQLEQTLELMNIESSVMVPVPSRNREYREYLVSIDDAPDSSRLQALISALRRENVEEPILIFFFDENEVNSMYDKLDGEASNGNLPFSTFYNLRERIEDDRNLLRRDLNEGVPGVYLACLQDHNWLFTTSSVATIINYRPPDCAQAYRYRRQRLRDHGKVLTIARSLDLNAFPEDLFHLLSNLTGYDEVNPCIDKLRKAFEDETRLRNTLRFELLS